MAKIINIESIEDGMLLSEPIINKFGQSLLPAGATLKTSHIRLFKTWNIRTISIKSQATETETEISQEMLELAREKIKRKMKWIPRNTIENDMVIMAVRQHAKYLLDKSKEI
jgi:hypothetical protein